MRAARRLSRLLRAVNPDGPARLLVADEDHEPRYPTPDESAPDPQT